MEKTVNTYVIHSVLIKHVTDLTEPVLLQAKTVYMVKNDKLK